MVVTITAISFIALSVGVGMCGWWFFGAFNRSSKSHNNQKIGFLIALFFFSSALHSAVLGFGALFFALHPEILFFIEILGYICLFFFAYTALYMVFYIFFPLRSPFFPLTFLLLLGLVGLITAFADPQLPSLTGSNIDWNTNLNFSLAMFNLFLVSLGSGFYVFYRLFIQAVTKEMQRLSLTIAILALMGIINTFSRLVLLFNSPAVFRSHILDITIGVTASIFIVSFFIIPIFRSKSF